MAEIIDINESEIIEKIKGGSAQEQNAATSVLINAYKGIVIYITQQSIRHTEISIQDLLNDSISDLIHLIRSGKYDKDRAKLSTVFYSIVRYKWMNILNKNKVKRHHDNHRTYNNTEDSFSVNYYDEKVKEEELKAKVREAIEKLDNRCFQIIYKYWIEEKKLVDIAREMNISIEAAKKRHERCRKKLKTLMKKDPRIEE